MIFAVNKITEGLRTFYRCFIEKKKDKQFLLLMKGDAVTPQILFLHVEFLDGGKWEKHFPVLFSGNMAQLRNFWDYGGAGGAGAEFPVIRVMEKPKFLHSGTCTSTSTWRVTLKAPLLSQFPYCKLSDNNNRRSNYRLMNVLFCTRALLPDFSKYSK